MEEAHYPIHRWIIIAAAALLLPILIPSQAKAGYFELSGGFSYDKNNYGDDDYSWDRKWGASFGYHFSERSEIELSFQDVVERTSILNFEDTTFHDQIYSVDWVQALTGKDFPIQPYFKVGVGQLDRTATGSYGVNGSSGSPPAELDQVTPILGLGLRIYLTRNFGLRGEATTYLTSGISSWNQNISITGGVSFYF
jgi:hypothetical protein